MGSHFRHCSDILLVLPVSCDAVLVAPNNLAGPEISFNLEVCDLNPPFKKLCKKIFNEKYMDVIDSTTFEF